MHIDIGRRKDRKIYGREVLTLPIYYETIESKKKERTKANENKKKVIKIKYKRQFLAENIKLLTFFLLSLALYCRILR